MQINELINFNMTHGMTKNLYEGLNTLIKYLIDNEIKSQYLHYGLKRNLRILEKEIKLIQESTSERLVELERKIYSFREDILKEEPTTPSALLYSISFNKLTEEEKDEHKNLVDEYNKFLLKDNEVKLYLLQKDEVKHLPLVWYMSDILDNFLVEE